MDWPRPTVATSWAQLVASSELEEVVAVAFTARGRTEVGPVTVRWEGGQLEAAGRAGGQLLDELEQLEEAEGRVAVTTTGPHVRFTRSAGALVALALAERVQGLELEGTVPPLPAEARPEPPVPARTY